MKARRWRGWYAVIAMTALVSAAPVASLQGGCPHGVHGSDAGSTHERHAGHHGRPAGQDMPVERCCDGCLDCCSSAAQSPLGTSNIVDQPLFSDPPATRAGSDGVPSGARIRYFLPYSHAPPPPVA